VRNVPDRRVEAVAEGSDEALEAFVAWYHRGPDWARVEAVEVTREPATDEFAGFGIRY